MPHLERALAIVQALQEAGFTALFAGGWVRDFIMNRISDDIDIATNAHPEEVVRLFPRSVTVGAQFGVVRVVSAEGEFEIASFRSDAQYIDGRRPERVDLHSSPEEDAKRRDFTINGLFYDPIAKKIFDFVGGQRDIELHIVRAIGDPLLRFQEDRLRLIRAIRFKNVLRFSIEQNTWNAICSEAPFVVPSVSPERIWQELQKMFEKGVLGVSLNDMASCGLLQSVFPEIKNLSTNELTRRITLVSRSRSRSLASSIALLFDSKTLLELAERYHLSKIERREFDLFQKTDLLQKEVSDVELISLYAKTESEDFLGAISAASQDQEAFLSYHQQKRKELAFWIDQVRNNSYLVTGEDLQRRGIKPGKEMGLLLAKLFQISITKRITDKEALLNEVLR